MTSITPPANILLTGGTGFVGSAVLANLLSKNFTVRAAVRSLAKAAPLEAAFKSYIDSGKLTFTVVPDITVAGAFEAALIGIDGVVHCASPLLPSDPKADPQDLIGPAVNGTIGVLRDSANVSSVKRIVVTSSVVTVLEPKEGKYVYTEADWFDTAPKLIEQLGVGAPGGLKYVASKVLAERAAWKWVEENKPSYEFVTVLPPWVWGKSQLADPAHIRPEASNYRLLFALVSAKKGSANLIETTDFTDVLDIAEGHVRALVTPGISGQRFLLIGGSVTWQDTLNLIATNPVDGLTVPLGQPGSGKSFAEVSEKTISGEKAVKELGLTYRAPKDTIHDAVAQAIELGWKLEGTHKSPDYAE